MSKTKAAYFTHDVAASSSLACITDHHYRRYYIVESPNLRSRDGRCHRLGSAHDYLKRLYYLFFHFTSVTNSHPRFYIVIFPSTFNYFVLVFQANNLIQRTNSGVKATDMCRTDPCNYCIIHGHRQLSQVLP